VATQETQHCPRCAELADEVGHLKAAIEHRDVIGQAKGILMARERCTADEAFNMLRMASQRENRKLHEIAVQLAGRAAGSSATAGLGPG